MVRSSRYPPGMELTKLAALRDSYQAQRIGTRGTRSVHRAWGCRRDQYECSPALAVRPDRFDRMVWMIDASIWYPAETLDGDDNWLGFVLDGSVVAGELYGGWKSCVVRWGSEVSLWLPESSG